ncbi:helix-turn-helix domain-containing protein [Citricoccus sp. GCM10030269]|uniref:TetR/AcrR family transcriptional regulator n=1 Tax=Citricoccus sp. GCM10030269 TaxID=3273388 RepID=UPI0036236490
MPPAESTSLRERKKTETWHAIHDAAADLALDGDMSCVTVEAIASEAGISQRTFFNYFSTKEDAILGVRAPTVPELPEDFLDGDGLIHRTTELLLSVGRSTYAEGDAERRGRLFDKFPHLLLRRREMMLQGEDLVYQAIAEAMAQHPEWAHGLNSHSVEETARMLTMAAGVPLRYLVGTRGTTGEYLDRHTVDDALDLYQDLYRKLS